MTAYEPKQEVAAGMGVLPGRERQAAVYPYLQKMCSWLQAEFPGVSGRLSALQFQTV